MKHFPLTAIFLLGMLILSACSGASAIPAPAPTAASASADPPTETSVPQSPQIQASPTALSGKLISSNGVEFTLPAGLGADATSNIVPEVLAPEPVPGGNPAYLQFKLQGYPLPGTQYIYAQIQVYDAAAYAADFAVGSSNSKALKALLAAPDMPLTQDVMPKSYLLLASNMQRLSSAEVKGVRMLSMHGNGLPLATNDDLTYQFQGLTTDGKFYVVVDLPISAPFLQANIDAPVPTGGIAPPQDGTGYPAYVAQIANLLNEAETAGTLSPAINLMDSLVQSLKLNSADIALPTPLPTLMVPPTLTVTPTLTVAPTPTATPIALPARPTGLRYEYDCSTGDLQITLTWNSVANVDGYRIYRAGALVKELPTTSYIDILPLGTSVGAYSITAFNSAGESLPYKVSVDTSGCQ